MRRLIVLLMIIGAIVPTVVDAGQARISKSFSGMTLAGDGVWEIDSPVWIDDVLDADGFDANLDTTFDRLGTPLNVFTIIDSSTYNLFDDYSPGSTHHTAGGFLSRVSPVAIGAEDAPAMGNRLSQTVNAAGFVLTGATDATPTINFDNLGGFTGAGQYGITFEQGKDDFAILIQNLCFTSNDDGGLFTSGNRTAMIQSFAPGEADALLPIFRNLAVDANRCFYSVSHLSTDFGGFTNNFKASGEVEMQTCGFRYNRFNATPAPADQPGDRETDPGSPMARNRSHHIYSNAHLGAKVTGFFEWENCTFIGVLQTDYPVGSGDPGDDLDPQLGLWSIWQGDDLNGPDWGVRRSILFNMNRYSANAHPPILQSDIIEWDDTASPVNVAGGAIPDNVLLEDPMFVDVTASQPNPTATDIKRAFNTQPGSSAKDPNFWGFADSRPPPSNSVRGWILY